VTIPIPYDPSTPVRAFSCEYTSQEIKKAQAKKTTVTEYSTDEPVRKKEKDNK
jgi:hypothetical protein